MQSFEWVDAASVEQAAVLLAETTDRTPILAKAGGMDLLDLMKEGILAPARLVNLKTIPGLGGTDELWYDRPPDVGGFWRLATPRAYAYHLGNVPEPWMPELLAQVEAERRKSKPAATAPVPPARRPITSRIPWRTRQWLASGLKRSRFAASLLAKPLLPVGETVESR